MVTAGKGDNSGTEALQVLMARQPIYTKSQDVVAFELLFRDPDGKFVQGLADKEATLGVLSGTYSSISRQGQIRNLPCFLKVTDSFLLDNNMPDLPRNSFIIEILGHSRFTPAMVNRVKALAEKGYRLALADYDPTDERFAPLLNIVHVLKIDIQKLGLKNLPPLLQKLRPFHLELLADKVETKEEFRLCLEMGFELYMGYFLSRPGAGQGQEARRQQGAVDSAAGRATAAQRHRAVGGGDRSERPRADLPDPAGSELGSIQSAPRDRIGIPCHRPAGHGPDSALGDAVSGQRRRQQAG